MQVLFDDLCDFIRTRLGLGINVMPTRVNLADVLAEELDELRAIHPGRQIELHVMGDSQEVWDGQRLQQLLGNLVSTPSSMGHKTPRCASG